MPVSTNPAGVDVCLVVPPFESVHHPNLGTAVLKSACQARGIATHIVYGGMMLAARVGIERYDAIYDSPMNRKIGDRLFRRHAYPPETAARLPEPEPLPPRLQAAYDAVEESIEPVLGAMVDAILALEPRIVGVTSSFQQNLAAGAVTRLLKARAPEVLIVMGGPNVAGPLARGIARAFPWIDRFFSGEADIDFPDFCERYLRDGTLPAERVVASEPIGDMRTVPVPDFGDFFAALRPLQAAGALPGWLPRYLMAETSRGCWWGAKHHCTFCGLNNEGMHFREKPVTRVLEELEALRRWDVPRIMMTDNIMPRRYLTDLLPMLAEREHRYGLFYEIKANLSEAQVDTLVRGGVVAIQPGIEALSSDVLRLMRKGVSAHQNIAVLRHAAGVGLQVFWNLIYGFPGERAEDYEDVLALLPKLHHLFPPAAWNPILIDRYSPFFSDPVGMGVAPIAPQPAYRALYPPEIATEEVAYHFSGDYSTDLLDRPELVARIGAAVREWREAWKTKPVPMLQMIERGGAALICDTRAAACQTMTPLSAEQRAALIALEHAHAREGLDPALAACADWLVERGFAIDHEGKLMSIVVRPRPDVARTRVLAPLMVAA